MALRIVGRRSSVFTRLPLVFAEVLGVPFELVPIRDMTETAAGAYAGNPALKLPILHTGSGPLFGALNICRAIAEQAPADVAARVVWPEQLRDVPSRNAQELIWHGMAAQVQLVMGTVINKLPADDPFFRKARLGLKGALAWLDEHATSVVNDLPASRSLSVLEASLLCLVDHLLFRPSVPLAPYPRLTELAAGYGQQEPVRRTAYRFD